MKVISVDDAKHQLSVICEQALSGEIVRLQSINGDLELTPVPKNPKIEALSSKDLAACYDNSDWASFENHSGKASD